MNYLEKRFIPPHSEQILIPEVDAVVFQYEKDKRPIAIGYQGRRAKPSFHLIFKNNDEREQYINRFFDRLTQYANEKKKRQAYKHHLKEGDILVSKWGVDQTNVDFYQVVNVLGPRSVLLQRISQRVHEYISDMSCHVVPAKNHFEGIPFRKVVKVGDVVKIEAYCIARAWDGKPCFSSSYA